jgi:hypothetical protein
MSAKLFFLLFIVALSFVGFNTLEFKYFTQSDDLARNSFSFVDYLNNDYEAGINECSRFGIY